MFTKLDANSGLWQIPLDEDFKLLTTFKVPFSRNCFKRFPFSIRSVPEIFQWTMSAMLEGLDGMICRMDDILIHGRNQMEHDVRVQAALFRIQEAGLTLNVQRCEFSQGRIKFQEHIVDVSVRVSRCSKEDNGCKGSFKSANPGINFPSKLTIPMNLWNSVVVEGTGNWAMTLVLRSGSDRTNSLRLKETTWS